ncbi:hypothetical protein [Sphingomonas sp. SAFR-052]|uniref:hypothetical protein n=1 Tax=Sphingomonas sp. SAFR-052 TaxID=3436867 RepID=UPI003F7F277C
MTAPRMTPTNDAPVTVEQCDRDGCADFELMVGRINEGDAARIRAGEWDQTRNVLWFARHRLAALASAPAGDGMEAPIRNLAFEIVRESLTPQHDRNKAASEPEGYREKMREFVDLVAPKAAERGAGTYGPVHAEPEAALARPRAAVGEQSRSRRLTEEEARELVGFEPETILTCLREWGYVEDAALQSPPAKV